MKKKMLSEDTLGESGNILTVSEFTMSLKSLLETNIPPTWVRGEISNLRKQTSGHCYFTLKDSGSQLSCVLFRGNALGMALELRDGLQVLIYGEISVYEARGNYQMIVRLVLDDGMGKLQLAFEQLKSKLATEGFFDSNKKKPLPPMPKTIGVITSPTGAALQDFISILKRRQWTGRLIILPSLVQGKEAAEDLCKQVQRAEALRLLDVLVLARGGGSLEDLWCFNDERLIRALANCTIPLISAIGHETDFTLCDFVADRRAETPSAAAEIITQPFREKLQSLQSLQQRLQILSPKNRFEYCNLKLDDLTNRLSQSLQIRLLKAKEELSLLKNRLKHCSPQNRIDVSQESLRQLHKRLLATGIDAQLRRGFAILKNKEGHFINSKANIHSGDTLTVTLADGSVDISAN